jgi:hypothetical protein
MKNVIYNHKTRRLQKLTRHTSVDCKPISGMPLVSVTEDNEDSFFFFEELFAFIPEFSFKPAIFDIFLMLRNKIMTLVDIKAGTLDLR